MATALNDIRRSVTAVNKVHAEVLTIHTAYPYGDVSTGVRGIQVYCQVAIFKSKVFACHSKIEHLKLERGQT